MPPKARSNQGDIPHQGNLGRCGTQAVLIGELENQDAKMMPTAAWRISLARALRPRLRLLEILMKSSRKPTKPMPTMRNSRSSPDADGPRRVRIHHPHDQVCHEVADEHRGHHHGSAHGGGVPRFVWWEVGPSSRMNCP